MAEIPRGRWFRFSLRTLFVLVTALCCWLGWESSVVRQRQALRKELSADGTFQFTPADEWSKRYPAGSPVADQATIPLVRRWLGDEAIQEISYVPHFQGFSAANRARLAKAFPEAEVRELLFEPCHPGCFPSGTLVETPHGPRSIETIEPGDRLAAFLPRGQSVEAVVQSVFVTENRLWQVETEGGTLLTTKVQPLCLAFDRIRPAGELQPGDAILCRQQGEIRPVQVVRVIRTDRIETVFNLVLGDSQLFVAGGFLARSKPPVEIAGR